MIRPRSLLELSRDLAVLDKRRPRQASLRRSISTAYYALFHLLIEAATDQLLGSGSKPAQRAIKGTAGRWFTHQRMAEICLLFQSAALPGKLRKALPAEATQAAVSQELQHVARAFVVLQNARHAADYDPFQRYTRQTAKGLVERAEKAFELWDQAGADPFRATFLLLLLTGEGVIKER